MFPKDTTILVVDDLESIRELMVAYLSRLGYKDVLEASDGQQAFEIINASRVAGKNIKLIISDWNMPKLNGIELLKLIRADNEWKSLPFLLMTTESEKPKVVEAIKSGVTNYMVKPINEATFQEKLERTWEKLNPKT